AESSHRPPNPLDAAISTISTRTPRSRICPLPVLDRGHDGRPTLAGARVPGRPPRLLLEPLVRHALRPGQHIGLGAAQLTGDRGSEARAADAERTSQGVEVLLPGLRLVVGDVVDARTGV